MMLAGEGRGGNPGVIAQVEGARFLELMRIAARSAWLNSTLYNFGNMGAFVTTEIKISGCHRKVHPRGEGLDFV